MAISTHHNTLKHHPQSRTEPRCSIVSTKPNPRAWHPPSDPPTMLQTHGTAPNTSLHHMGRRCQKAGRPGKSLRSSWSWSGRSSSGQGPVQVQRCMEQLCHSAVLLCLADHNISLPSSMGMLKSCARAQVEPMRAPESRFDL